MDVNNSGYLAHYTPDHHLIIELPIDEAEDDSSEETLFEIPLDVEETEENFLEAASTTQNPTDEKVHKIIKHTLGVIDNGFELTSKALEIFSQKELQSSVDTAHLFVKSAMGIHAIAQGKFSLDITKYFQAEETADEVMVAKSVFSATTLAGAASKSVELITRAASCEKVSELFEKTISPLFGKVCKDPAMLLSTIASLEQAYSLPETTEEERYIREITIAKYQVKAAVKGAKVVGAAVITTGAVMASSAVTVPLAILGFGVGAVDVYLTYNDIKKEFFQSEEVDSPSI